ncbi:unnamed protein product [Brassica oleracea var. botrytis]|uniref:Uncharacterized protein n=1 Tax=Brassica oleracea TaxID=3712 RepID=A0A3P6C8G2_BRAOL|nr:unnamed protein product [Brassica oleracea]
MDTYRSDVQIGAGRRLRHHDEISHGCSQVGKDWLPRRSTGSHCLLLQLDATWVDVSGVFANFLRNPAYRFLGFHPDPVLGRNLAIPNYYRIINHGFAVPV